MLELERLLDGVEGRTFLLTQGGGSGPGAFSGAGRRLLYDLPELDNVVNSFVEALGIYSQAEVDVAKVQRHLRLPGDPCPPAAVVAAVLLRADL
jgi:hypothetical protein